MKAVYVHRRLAFRHTHDLNELGSGLEAHGVEVPANVRDAVVLTRFAVHARYPGAGLAVSQREHSRALRLADGVVRWAEEMCQEV